MASITAINVAPVVAKASVAKASTGAVAPMAVKPAGLKAATLFTKTEASPFVSNGYNTSAMHIWQPTDNKYFETFSYLPPLTDDDITKQIEYMTRNGFTPCLEFSAPEFAYTSNHGVSGIDSRSASGYYDNRYWSMWKLPMFGCTDGDQVLSEMAKCVAAFPNSYVRVAGFDAVRQMQMVSFLVHRPPGCNEARAVEDRSVLSQ